MAITFYKGIMYGSNERKLKVSCLTGDTNIIIQDKNIKTTSTINYSVIGASGKYYRIENIAIIDGQITITFVRALTENATVLVDIRNL